MKNYVRRAWLNDETSASTGSVCAFDGQAHWTKDIKRTSFLELTDCHCKIRLYLAENDTHEQFLNKMIKLRDFVDDFINHLKQENK